MINFRVENIEKTVDYLREVGTEIIDEISSYPYGKFVHILDPEGNLTRLNPRIGTKIGLNPPKIGWVWLH